MTGRLIYSGMILVSVCIGHTCAAQSTRDTIHIRDVNVYGQAKPIVDTAITHTDAYGGIDDARDKGKRMSEVLSENTAVYLKNYGVGQLSSISINGSSAAQADILWNGIRLNNASTGQVDLALFDYGTIDQIHLRTESSNTSIGGSIDFRNELHNDSLIRSANVIRYGSYNTINLLSNNSYGHGIFSGSTKINYLNSDNDFAYRNYTQIGAPEQVQTNANTKLLSFLQQLQVRWRPDYSAGVIFWLTDADRQIAPLMTDLSDHQHEWDQSYRGLAYLNGGHKAFTFSFKSAYLYDKIRYTDPAINVDSRSGAMAIRNLLTGSYVIRQRVYIDGSVHYDRESATSTGFDTARMRNISGIDLGAYYRYKWIRRIGFSLRQELLEAKGLPFAPSAFIELEQHLRGQQYIDVAVSGARAYRIPALNDLYWSEGGNPTLRPEHAWRSSVAILYTYHPQRCMLTVQASPFYNYVTDWILWHPTTSGIWMPDNVKRVLSRGINASVKVQNKSELKDKGFVVVGYAGYSLSKTTSLDAISANDNSAGKQLIYVPLHNVTGSLHVQYRRYYIRGTVSYTGEVFTTTDNTQSLKGYVLSNLEIGKDFYFNHQQIGLSCRVNNIGNSEYQVVELHPMPGRNYEGCVRINLNR